MKIIISIAQEMTIKQMDFTIEIMRAHQSHWVHPKIQKKKKKKNITRFEFLMNVLDSQNFIFFYYDFIYTTKGTAMAIIKRSHEWHKLMSFIYLIQVMPNCEIVIICFEQREGDEKKKGQIDRKTKIINGHLAWKS